MSSDGERAAGHRRFGGSRLARPRTTPHSSPSRGSTLQLLDAIGATPQPLGHGRLRHPAAPPDSARTTPHEHGRSRRRQQAWRLLEDGRQHLNQDRDPTHCQRSDRSPDSPSACRTPSSDAAWHHLPTAPGQAGSVQHVVSRQRQLAGGTCMGPSLAAIRNSQLASRRSCEGGETEVPPPNLVLLPAAVATDACWRCLGRWPTPWGWAAGPEALHRNASQDSPTGTAWWLLQGVTRNGGGRPPPGGPSGRPPAPFTPSDEALGATTAQVAQRLQSRIDHWRLWEGCP
jgi:hypothetical protein